MIPRERVLGIQRQLRHGFYGRSRNSELWAEPKEETETERQKTPKRASRPHEVKGEQFNGFKVRTRIQHSQ